MIGNYGIKNIKTGENFLQRNGDRTVWHREEFYKFASRHDAMEEIRAMGLNGNDRYIIMAESDMTRNRG